MKNQPEPVTERYTSPMKEFEESEKEQRKMTPSSKGQRIPWKQTRPRKSIGTLDENETEEEEESFRRQKYQQEAQGLYAELFSFLCILNVVVIFIIFL